jgi:hypothetical protein
MCGRAQRCRGQGACLELGQGGQLTPHNLSRGTHTTLLVATAATSDSVFVDGSSVAHGPNLACDDDTISWFGSNANGNSSSLVLDIGPAGPYYDQLLNMTVWNRWAGMLSPP